MTSLSLQESIRQALDNRQARGESPILLMSHLVLGHPSLEENLRVIDHMVAAGVEIMELQFPFSEPIADGPVIAYANQQALDGGFKVDAGLALLQEVCHRYPIPFLVMTYFNILFARGVETFIQQVAQAGAKGLIVPDLPLEDAAEAMALCQREGLSWIQLFTPTTSDQRMQEIGAAAQGFCYCVARKGVTGKETAFGGEVNQFIERCRQATSTPLAVGFGVKSASDVSFLQGQAEIAVVGSEAIRIHEKEGASGVGAFFASLRPNMLIN
ncbi:MAG: tryptophan synthase subunit alpha [Magnetococcales bacterium]|nr:tryptophan synthase subunit alpha [Magnetococcales bacterium]NGZ27647.1 tryptophan synthase subunit alpha [Magnetococcales bacterium]